MKLQAEHGVVCSRPQDQFGYFAWPTVARMADGTLVVVSSGLRQEHVCPFGKTVLFTSRDDGKSWSEPIVVNDSPFDDRDAGVVSLGGRSLLVSWFTLDIRKDLDYCNSTYGETRVQSWMGKISQWTDELARRWEGSWIRVSADGRAWGEPVKVPVSAPHGPIRLRNGTLLYLGKEFGLARMDQRYGPIKAFASEDGGQRWNELGTVPNGEKTENLNYYEAHVVELPSGKLLGLMRYERDTAGYIDFSLFQTESTDGGKTWSRARHLGIYGSPPHLIVHSTGAIICAYGYRQPPFGQRVMISRDEGETWQTDYILRDDGPDADLGYPASVELADGRIFTVYYQRTGPDLKTSILWSRWSLPKNG